VRVGDGWTCVAVASGLGVAVAAGLGVAVCDAVGSGVAVRGSDVAVGGTASVRAGDGSGVCLTVIVPVTLGVAPGSVGSAVGGVNWVGVGSSVSLGMIIAGGSVAVAVSVGLGVIVAAGAARVAVATERWRVGVGVIWCVWPLTTVTMPSA